MEDERESRPARVRRPTTKPYYILHPAEEAMLRMAVQASLREQGGQSEEPVTHTSATRPGPRPFAGNSDSSRPMALAEEVTSVAGDCASHPVEGKHNRNSVVRSPETPTVAVVPRAVPPPVAPRTIPMPIARKKPLVSMVQCVENTAAQVVTFLSDCVANPTSYMDMEAKLRIKAPVPDRWIPDDDRSVTTKSETSDMMDIVVEPHTGAQPPAGNPVMPSRPAPEEPAAKRPMRCKPAAFDLPPCPEYHPTVQEFEDPLKFIASIREEAERYGICKIVPPAAWQPVCQLDELTFRFPVRLQRLHQLYRRTGPCTMFLECLQEHLQSEKVEMHEVPTFAGIELDLYNLKRVVDIMGGLQEVINKKRWGKVADELRIARSAHNREARLQGFYYNPEQHQRLEAKVIEKLRARDTSEEPFGFDTGKSHSLKTFKKLADDFKDSWFRKKSVSPAEIETAYWQILEQPENHVCVCYGSDVDTTVHGSGFPLATSSDTYAKFGWNLNVLPGLPDSLLKHVSGISGISMPWLYVGMLFSSFCWHVEDNYLYSINYHHFGDPKLWYGVPGSDAAKLEETFQMHMPQEFAKRQSLLHDITTMLSPKKLVANGVRVCSTLQNAGEFVVTFPQGYHAGFSLGFNCGEAVNFASADWIPMGSRAIEKYRIQRRPVSLDQEQLIIETAKRETSPNVLQYVYPELQALRDREYELRYYFFGKGLQQTSLEQYTGGPVVLANLFFSSGHRMGRMTSAGAFPGLAFSKQGAKAPSGSSAFESCARMGRMGPPELAQGYSTCELCNKICHVSMLAIPETESERDDLPAVLCVHCGKENGPSDKYVLVVRYGISELDELLSRIRYYLPASMIATKKENGVKHEADVQLDTISVRDAVLSPPFDKHRPEQIYKLSLHQGAAMALLTLSATDPEAVIYAENCTGPDFAIRSGVEHQFFIPPTGFLNFRVGKLCYSLRTVSDL